RGASRPSGWAALSGAGPEDASRVEEESFKSQTGAAARCSFFTDGALPALDGTLRRARQSQRFGRRIARQCSACAYGGATPYGNRRNQLGIRADKGVVLDSGAEFVDAIVIASNGARADVDTLAYLRIADIGQMIGFAACAQRAVLDLDEVAYMRMLAQLGTRTQAGIRPYPGLRPHGGLVQMAVGIHLRPRTHLHIAQHAVRPHAHTIFQHDLAFENATDIYIDVATALQRATQIEARRVGQCHARIEQPVGLLGLPCTLQLRLLLAA